MKHLPPSFSLPALPLVTLDGDSQVLESLEMGTLNRLTPALRAGDFYTPWTPCWPEHSYFRFVRRGAELRAFVCIRGPGVTATIQAALRHCYGSNEAQWSEALGAADPVNHVRAALPQRVVNLLDFSTGEGYRVPLAEGLTPMQERVVAELHLLGAKQQAAAALRNAAGCVSELTLSLKIERVTPPSMAARTDRMLN